MPERDGWNRMPETFSDEVRAAERRALLAYCKLDTLAMVRLLGRLEELAG